MIACAVTTNATDFCRSLDASFPAGQMKEIDRVLRTGAPFPGTESFEVRWHTWVFANGKIRAVIRPDGWILQRSSALNPRPRKFSTRSRKNFLRSSRLDKNISRAKTRFPRQPLDGFVKWLKP